MKTIFDNSIVVEAAMQESNSLRVFHDCSTSELIAVKYLEEMI